MGKLKELRGTHRRKLRYRVISESCRTLLSILRTGYIFWHFKGLDIGEEIATGCIQTLRYFAMDDVARRLALVDETLVPGLGLLLRSSFSGRSDYAKRQVLWTHKFCVVSWSLRGTKPCQVD